MTFVHNPSTDARPAVEQTSKPPSDVVAHLVMTGQMSESKITPQTLGNALGLDITIEEDLTDEHTEVPLGDSEPISLPERVDDKMYNDYVGVSKLLARELGFEPGDSGLVVNGRVIGPIGRGGFIAADFKALEEYEYKKRTETAVETIESVCPWVVGLER